jgi:hypothetical protein
MHSMPLPTPNPIECVDAVLASSHRHWEAFGAQHEGQHFLSLAPQPEEGAETAAHVDEVLEQLLRLAYHRARQAVRRFVSDLRTVSSYDYIKHRSMLEAAQLMKDSPAETPYMDTIRKSLGASLEERRMLDLAALSRDAKLAVSPNPAEAAIFEAFVAGRDNGLKVLVSRNDRCNGADLMLGKTNADQLLFRLPSEDGPVLSESARIAIDNLGRALMGRDRDGPLLDDVMAELQRLCELASDAAGDWTGRFFNSMERMTPSDLIRFEKLIDTAKLVRDDPASLSFFKPLLEELQDVRKVQLHTADALRMMGYDEVTNTFSPKPPVLTTVLDTFKSTRDYGIRYERMENPSSPGVAFMEQPSEGEAEIIVRQPKNGYLGPSIGLKGSEHPNPTALEDLGPFYEFVARDIRDKISPRLTSMGLRPVVQAKDAENEIWISFETSDGKGYGAVDLYFEGPQKSTLSHATWRHVRYGSGYNERRDVGTDGWFAIHTPPGGREVGDFNSDEEAIECTIRWTLENDLFWNDDHLLEKQVRSEAIADAWDHIKSHVIDDDHLHGTIVRDDDGTEHLTFNDPAGVSHVISLTKNDMWAMSSGDSTVLETDDWNAVAALIDETVAYRSPLRKVGR